MFVTNIFPAPLILQSNYNFPQNKSNFSLLETKILSQINYFRVNTKEYLNYYKSQFDLYYIENIINILLNKEKKLNSLKIKKEISLAGRDYINYLIENNIPKTYFDINKGNKAYFIIQQLLSKYGQRKGKIFETVIINSNSAEEIVNKLIKDEKAIKILLNPDMKFINIACGFIPKWKNICVIIDIIENFIAYKTEKNDNNSGIQILNEIYLDENIAQIEEKYETRTHKGNYEISRNNDNELKSNYNTSEGTAKFKRILPLYIKDVNPFFYKKKEKNFQKSFSFNNFQNIGKTNNNNKKELNDNIKNKNENIIYMGKNNDKQIQKNLLLKFNEKKYLNNNANNKLKEINIKNNVKQYKIITKNLNLKNININANEQISNKNKILNLDINEINNSFLIKDNKSNSKTENIDSNENNENISQPFEQINDISNVNQNKKQNSFFSLDTEISTLLNPKKNNESQDINKFSFTPNKSLDNQEQIEQNINGFCLNDKEKFFKNNRREIKNMIKIYNQERMAKNKINNLRNDINNAEINEVKNTATFFYNNNNRKNIKEKNKKQIYQKIKPSLSNSYKKIITKHSSFKSTQTEINTLPEKIISNKMSFHNDNISKNKENKKKLSLITDNNIIFNNGKKRIISFKANRRLYKNKSLENIINSQKLNEQVNNQGNNKERKYLIINPILANGLLTKNEYNVDINGNIKKDKYKGHKKHIEEINIDLSNNYRCKNNFNINYNSESNICKYIYKKNRIRDDKMNNFNFYNKSNNNFYTEIDEKYKITNIGKISNTIQNTIKNKYIIINTQIK